jgi:outer membrane usher protein
MSARRDAVCAALLGFGVLLGSSVPGRAADLILAVTIDGRPQPGFGDFVERGGRLFARPEDLAAIGLTVPADITPDADGLVSVDAVPGLTYDFDPAEQTVAFGASFDRLAGSDIRVRPTPAALPTTRSATAFVLNYDATVTRETDGELRWGSFLGGRVSTPWGVGETTGFIRSGDGDPEIVRLESWVETSLPDSMITLRAGDTITGGLSWTRPIRFGGLVARRDFDLRPDLITTPLPGFDGTAEVPSAVDVVVNGIRQGRYDVEPGPFHIGDVPVVTGSGQVTLVVRDALGRERLESFDYFASPSLLAADLFDWSVETGRLREGYGEESFAYGPWIASATARWGATSWLTLEGHAEGAQGLVSGGGGAVVGLGLFGAVSGFAAVSRQEDGITEDGTGGTRLGIAYDWSNGWLDLSAQAETTEAGFADLATLSGADYPSSAWRATAGLDLDALGSLGFSYVERHWRDRDDDRFLTASYSLPLPGSLYFGVTGFAVPDRDEWQVTASLSLTLGDGLRAATRTRLDQEGWRDTTVSLAQSSAGIDDLSWRLSGTTGRDRDQLYGAATWRTAYGDLSARGVATDQVETDDGWSAELGARGALVASAAGVGASRRIDGPFAIVDVAGVPGVTVRNGNRPVGTTGWLGPVIVPDLRPWDENTIAIDALDVPFDVAIHGDRETVVPAGHAAVAVAFAAEGTSAIVVALVDETGRPLPQGASASADGVPSAFPVGYDGEAYFEGVGESFTVEISGLWGRCEALVTMPPPPATHVGPVTCRKTL